MFRNVGYSNTVADLQGDEPASLPPVPCPPPLGDGLYAVTHGHVSWC